MDYEIINIKDLSGLSDIISSDIILISNDKGVYNTYQTNINVLSNSILSYIQNMFNNIIYKDIKNLEQDITSKKDEYHNHIIDAYVVKQMINNINNYTYPVGSIFVTLSSGNPQDILQIKDSEWEKVSQGKCLWGASNDEQLCTTISAGLPKLSITQVSGWLSGWTDDTTISQDCKLIDSLGATIFPRCRHGSTQIIYQRTESVAFKSTHKHKIDSSCKLTFEYKDDIYRDEVSTVQPPAFCVNIWVRTK